MDRTGYAPDHAIGKIRGEMEMRSASKFKADEEQLAEAKKTNSVSLNLPEFVWLVWLDVHLQFAADKQFEPTNYSG